jgi:lysophospholipase L1-like esterase
MDRRHFLLLSVLGLSGCGGGSDAAPQTVAPPPVVVTPPVVTPPPVPKTATVFIGDSVLLGMMSQSTNPTYVNAAISGQTSVQMLARFQSDVLDRNPLAVVILAGENDVLRTPDPSTDSIARMAELAAQAGAKVVICLLPPVEDWSPANLISDPVIGRAAFARFNQSLKDLAAAFGYKVADLNTALSNPDGTQNAALFVADGTHPNLAGIQKEWEVVHGVL